LDNDLDKRAQYTDVRAVDARMVALAAAVEALSTGHARILAADLRAQLEAAMGAHAGVVSITSRRDPKR